MITLNHPTPWSNPSASLSLLVECSVRGAWAIVIIAFHGCCFRICQLLSSRHQIVWCYRDWTQLAEALHPVACAMSPPLRPSLPQTSKATLSCPVEGVVSLCCLVVESLTWQSWSVVNVLAVFAVTPSPSYIIGFDLALWLCLHVLAFSFT